MLDIVSHYLTKIFLLLDISIPNRQNQLNLENLKLSNNRQFTSTEYFIQEQNL